MSDEKKLKGYHIVPYEIAILNRKTFRKYLRKGKAPIATAFLEVLGDYKMQNKVSYNQYAMEWRWQWRDVKYFLNHIGFKIDTIKNQHSFSFLKLCLPIKSKNFNDDILGIAHKIFEEANAEALKKHLKKQKEVKSDSYKKIEEADAEALKKHLQNKEIKKYNIIYVEFKKIFSMYHKVNNILKKHGRSASRSTLDYCFSIYIKKLKNIPIDKLHIAVKYFLADKIVNTNQAIPMFSTLLNGFVNGVYDLEYYAAMNDENLLNAAKRKLAELGKEKKSKEDDKKTETSISYLAGFGTFS